MARCSERCRRVWSVRAGSFLSKMELNWALKDQWDLSKRKKVKEGISLSSPKTGLCVGPRSRIQLRDGRGIHKG